MLVSGRVVFRGVFPWLCPTKITSFEWSFQTFRPLEMTKNPQVESQLVARIRDHLLKCIKRVENNGINCQPQLVSRIFTFIKSWPSSSSTKKTDKNHHNEVFPFWLLSDSPCVSAVLATSLNWFATTTGGSSAGSDKGSHTSVTSMGDMFYER